MSITRFAVLPDERRLLLGIDKANLFKEGVVYEAIDVLGQIVLRPIGEYALPEKGYPAKYSTANEIIYGGTHLVTKEEMAAIQLANNS